METKMKTYQKFIVEAKRHEDELPFVAKTFDGTLADFKKFLMINLLNWLVLSVKKVERSHFLLKVLPILRNF